MGEVASIELDGSRVLVTFKVDKKLRLGDRTEAAIKTKSVLGAKILSVTSRGDGTLTGPIPVERTTPAYELPDALGDLATTVEELNTNQVSDSLATLAETLQDTPPELKVAVEGVGRLSETLDKRDAELRALLANANKATTVLAGRADQVVSLIKNTDALLVQLQTQSSALDEIARSISALATQLSGFIAENRATLRPALDKLNGVLAIVDGRKEQVQKALKLASNYMLHISETTGLRAVRQGLHHQPVARAIRAALHRRRVLRPRSGPRCSASDTVDRPAGRPTRHPCSAGALSAHRPGR